MGLFEKGPGTASGFGDLIKNISPATFSTGIIATIMGTTGPLVLVITAAEQGMLSREVAISWLFSIYFFGGLLSIILALWYKQPICGAWSIPGVLLVGAVLANFQIEQAVGAYLMSGVLVLLLGLSGYIKKVMFWLPQPIIMGMIAGAMLRFGTGIVSGVASEPWLALAVIAGWLLLSKYIPKIPGVLGALVFGTITAVILGMTDLSTVTLSLARPMIFMPQFSIDAFFSITLPLAIIVIGAENTQAMGVLLAEKYDPPVNTMIILSGIGGIITSFFGGHNANIAGPMTAICSGSESGPREGRYAASVVNGLLFGTAGIFAGTAATFIGALPAAMIAVVVGLSMIGVLTTAFTTAFSGRYKLGAFFALIIAASGITFFKIAAPFWALVGGVAISLILEKEEFISTPEGNKVAM